MKKLALLLTFGLVVSGALAQQKQANPGWTERAVAASITVAKNLYAKVQKEGRPLAEKMLKATPEYYKETQKSLQGFVKRVNQSELPKTFAEKQQMCLELWKLRGAVNVMALSDPDTLKATLKMQPLVVQQMQKELADIEAKLKKANLFGI